MKLQNKTEQIAHLQGQDKYGKSKALQEMLTAYRSTPHPATLVPPYEAMMNRVVRTKLDYKDIQKKNMKQEVGINENYEHYKRQCEKKSRNRNTKEHNFVLGDYVLLKQTMKRNKWSTAYEPAFYVVYRIDESSISVRRTTDGREVCSDSSHFKLANSVVETAKDIETKVVHMGENSRDNVLAETKEESVEAHENQDKEEVHEPDVNQEI